jgi:transcriptional regulator with XRE-family HTH domain
MGGVRVAEKRKTFADRLKEEREKKGVSAYALSKSCGLSRQALNKLEAGLRQPAWDTVQRIARALGLDCTAFADESIDMPEPAAPAKRGRPRKQPEAPAEVPEVKLSGEKKPKKKGGA